MRARGAKVTDIVVLVVAADDGIMPQTREAIDHARAAEVPIIVAINKIDKPGRQPRARQAGARQLRPRARGVGRRHHRRAGVGQDQGGHRAAARDDPAPGRRARAEGQPEAPRQGHDRRGAARSRPRTRSRPSWSRKARSRSAIPFVCGTEYGRIRAMMDDKGQRIESAGPSTPVEILGLGGVPEAGDVFVAVQDDAKARQVAEHRRGKQRDAEMAKTAKVSLDDLYQQIQSGEVRELKVVLKTDVQGSLEAVSDALRRLSTDDVRLNVIHGSVGGITESDVLLASASNAVIIGFNVRPEPKAAALAEREGVDIRLYTIIYDALERRARRARGPARADAAGEGPRPRRGAADVHACRGRASSRAASSPTARSCAAARRGCCATTSWCTTGEIGSLRRFKDDVREVASGYECGIGLEEFQDVKVGDVIEALRGRGGGAPARVRRPREVRRPPSARPEPGGSRPMVVGVLRLELLLPENHSLKGKRSVLRGDQGARAEQVQRVDRRVRGARSLAADGPRREPGRGRSAARRCAASARSCSSSTTCSSPSSARSGSSSCTTDGRGADGRAPHAIASRI